MNTGIKNKLKELVGEQIDLFQSDGGVFKISYPTEDTGVVCKILRILDEDCVVLGKDNEERFLSIDHIFCLIIRKK